MAELDLRHPEFGGICRDEAILMSELYRLTASIGASKYILENFCNDSSFEYFRKFEYSEITRLLINIAILVRKEIENHGNIDNAKSECVGSCEEKGMRRNINLQKACDKIIHAMHIHFSHSEVKTIYDGYLLPEVFCHGVRYDRDLKKYSEWKVQVDLTKFIKQSWLFI